MPLDYPVHRRTLPNGLRVVVSPDHTVPNVTVNLWVGVGSRHEQPGGTGFAHLFEHLMFQGSRSVRSGEHFEALMAVGGRANATTWFDRTNYFETVPTGALELALWLEADRHGHLLDAVTQANLDNQRDVVKEEKRQRYDNQPYGTALADLYAAVFPADHPYHHPTIGSMEDLDAAALEDVHAFFRRYYAPDNTVLTLCGDVEPEQGFDLVGRYLGPLSATARSQRPPLPQLGPLTEPVRVERTEAVPNDRLHVGFRLPVDESAELFAATVALDCLAGLTSSRLARRTVRREQTATAVHASAWGLLDGVSLGFVVLDAAPGTDPADLESALVQELERLAESGPTDAELEASLAQSERAWLSALASQEERADLLSRYTLLHDDPGLVNTHLDRVRAVRPDDVRAATRRWLAPDSRAVVAYLAARSDAEAVA
ncbi:insulinase family protein [Phycicoccus endophyticus]|uniref:Insulinase family protein n=1 Tax=Phycicoccus endophyticus TaxID=1690220 RepID=A0A7G9QYS4_9MICO|nr:pitrilysin family protein [Phycicoccus endophyticus]NHI20463.1 insulinase family protein [Phycicoccus endophyticus]QNN48499.1 insulinase family protein [Phycicoccus endophyticus]GGL30567.1 zinc protease [Phycicoccus endophyticus]